MVKYFLNFAVSNPDAEIIFHTSNMFFKVDYNTVYVVCSSAHSRVGGYQYIGNADDNLFHGPIYVLAKID